MTPTTVTPHPVAPPAAPAAHPAVPHAPPVPDAKTNPNPPAHATVPKGPDWWLMMKAFLTQGKRIASFAPSSRFMARKILDGIDWAKAGSIVELGAGTGPDHCRDGEEGEPARRAWW